MSRCVFTRRDAHNNNLAAAIAFRKLPVDINRRLILSAPRIEPSTRGFLDDRNRRLPIRWLRLRQGRRQLQVRWASALPAPATAGNFCFTQAGSCAVYA